MTLSTAGRPPDTDDTGSIVTTSSTDQSLGQLVASATKDLSQLLRQEVALAKAEISRDLQAAGKGAGMLGGAGVSGLLAVVFLGIAAAFGLAALGLPLGVGFLLVGAGYLAVAGVLALQGRRQLAQVGPPEKTIATIKDDLTWAGHPTRAV